MWCLVAERSSQLLTRQSAAKKQELREMLSQEEIAKAEHDAQLWRNHLKVIENSLGTNVEAISDRTAVLKATA
jgi:hypothetical protein